MSGGGARCDGAGYAHRPFERRDARGIPLRQVAVEVGRKESFSVESFSVSTSAHVGDLRDVPVFDLGISTVVVADPFDDLRLQRRAVGERLRQRRGDREEERVVAHRLRRAVPRCALAARDSFLLTEFYSRLSHHSRRLAWGGRELVDVLGHLGEPLLRIFTQAVNAGERDRDLRELYAARARLDICPVR